MGPSLLSVFTVDIETCFFSHRHSLVFAKKRIWNICVIGHGPRENLHLFVNQMLQAEWN